MPVTLKAALLPHSPLQQHVQPGMGAVRAPDRALLADRERRRIGDSLDLDGATRAAAPQDPRWDYILSVRDAGKLVGLEPHPARAAEIDVVIRKKESAAAVLRQHLNPGYAVAEWHWVTHGSIGLSRTGREARKLSQAGIQFSGRMLRRL